MPRGHDDFIFHHRPLNSDTIINLISPVAILNAPAAQENAQGRQLSHHVHTTVIITPGHLALVEDRRYRSASKGLTSSDWEDILRIISCIPSYDTTRTQCIDDDFFTTAVPRLARGVMSFRMHPCRVHPLLCPMPTLIVNTKFCEITRFDMCQPCCG